MPPLSVFHYILMPLGELRVTKTASYSKQDSAFSRNIFTLILMYVFEKNFYFCAVVSNK